MVLYIQLKNTTYDLRLNICPQVSLSFSPAIQIVDTVTMLGDMLVNIVTYGKIRAVQ